LRNRSECACVTFRSSTAIVGQGRPQVMVRALRKLLSTAALSLPARNIVLRRMAAPQRHYHGLAHIALLWSRHRRFAIGTAFRSPRDSRLIACAIAFHDVVYDPRRRDNERRSAQVWRRWAPADLPAADINWVAATIEATADHLAPYPNTTHRDRLRLWLLDLDLTPLGEHAHIFARNSLGLRHEYRHLTEQEWQQGRRAFLEKLRTAPTVFRFAPLDAAFGRRARRNIARAV
jgi:predicted metal-dependent HD superfamily phosphohydrolase